MKKTLAAFLALITISSVALVACNDDSPVNNDGGNNNGDEFEIIANPGTTESNTGSDTTDTGDNNNGLAGSFEDLSSPKTLYVVSAVRIRTEPTLKDSTVKVQVQAGTQLQATAKNKNWYKITYNNEPCYVVAEYVTDDATVIEYKDVAEDDTIKTLTIAEKNGTSQQVNLREAPVVYDDVKFVTVTNKEVTADKPLVILQKNTAGNWYKVQYNNKEYYVAINSGTYDCFNERLSSTSGPVGG